MIIKIKNDRINSDYIVKYKPVGDDCIEITFPNCEFEQFDFKNKKEREIAIKSIDNTMIGDDISTDILKDNGDEDIPF